MSQISKAAQTVNAQVLRDETVISANTNDRVYQLLKNIIDSMVDYQQFVNGTATGTNTKVATIPGIDAYSESAVYFIKNTSANSGAATLNITGVGAKAIKKNGGTDVSASELPADSMLILFWNAANDWFQLVGSTTGGGVSYFLGIYASLVALQIAHPTASPGEYAYVDAGIGTDIVMYIWDDDDADWVTGGAGGGTWGSITGTLSSQTDLQTALDAKLALAGGGMTGAINEAQGADIASATTTDIGAATGNSLTVTGTTTITGLGTVQAGTRRIVTFSGALTLTHNVTSLILPTAANITTAAGDVAEFSSLGSGNWKCTNYQRADGTSLVGGGLTSEQEDQLELAYLRSIYYMAFK